jgi:hypothetical protein
MRHQAGPKRQEVPLRAGRLEDLRRIDADPMEDQRQLVDEGDVDIALRVLDHLGRLGDLDAGDLVHSGRDDAAVHLGHQIEGARAVARDDLDDGRERVLLVSRVDPLW